jgi:hypothetical protein
MQIALAVAGAVTGAHIIRASGGLTILTGFALEARQRAWSMLTQQERHHVVAALGEHYPAWATAPEMRAPDVPEPLRLPWISYEQDDCALAT